MTSELRDAVEVWAKAHASYQSSVMAYAGTLCVKAADQMKPAAVIQAYGDEREAMARRTSEGMVADDYRNGGMDNLGAVQDCLCAIELWESGYGKD